MLATWMFFIALDKAPYQLESNLIAIADPSIPIEDVGTTSAEALPFEFVAAQLANAATVDEGLSVELAKISPASEYSVAHQPDIGLTAEALTATNADAILQAEGLYNAAASNDSQQESVADSRLSAQLPDESLVGLTDSNPVLAEHLASAIADNQSPNELLFGALSSIVAPLEWAADLLADSFVLLEIISDTISLSSDSLLPLEATAGTLNGTATIAEWAALIFGDGPLADELSAAAVSRVALWTELLSAQSDGAPFSTETLTSHALASNIVAEFLLACIAGGALSDEAAASVSSDTPKPGELLSDTMSSDAIQGEIISTLEIIIADALLPLEFFGVLPSGTTTRFIANLSTFMNRR